MGSEQVIRVSNNAMVQVDFEWDVDATGPVGRPSAPEANPHAAAIRILRHRLMRIFLTMRFA
jgi:hypothetical protein